MREVDLALRKDALMSGVYTGFVFTVAFIGFIASPALCIIWYAVLWWGAWSAVDNWRTIKYLQDLCNE